MINLGGRGDGVMGRFGVLLDVADRFQEMFGSDLDRFGWDI